MGGVRWTPEQARATGIELTGDGRARISQDRKPKPAKAPTKTESEEQQEIIRWWDGGACLVWGLQPEDLYAVPNGGFRTPAEARILLGEGVRPGRPDLGLDVTRPGYAGFRLEMKRVGEKGPRENQRQYLTLLVERGYACAVAHGAQEGIEAITRYLEGDHDQ